MKLGYTILYVPNVQETVQFYERAFGLKQKFMHESGDYGEMDTGSTTLAFANYEVAEFNEIEILRSSKSDKSPPIEIAFIAEDVENAFSLAVSAGAVSYKSPQKKPWGQTVAYVRDLNGFLVEICSSIA